VTFSYVIYNPSSKKYEEFKASYNFKPLKENYASFSIDSLEGVGYFSLNNEIILSIDLETGQFFKKQILYGDVFIKYEDEISNIIYPNNVINNILVSDIYIESNASFIKPILDGKTTIDDIQISLPSGMVNHTDNIDQLHTICGSSAFKSNYIKVKMKNLNLNIAVENDMIGDISNKLNEILPANSSIESIDFENYK
jgi:hypothetical protein